jgi:hypothetical protein
MITWRVREGVRPAGCFQEDPLRAARGQVTRRLPPGRNFNLIIANGPVLRPLRTNLNASLANRRNFTFASWIGWLCARADTVRSARGIRQLEVLDPHHEDDVIPVILEELRLGEAAHDIGCVRDVLPRPVAHAVMVSACRRIWLISIAACRRSARSDDSATTRSQARSRAASPASAQRQPR